jgi:hypothetical protein
MESCLLELKEEWTELLYNQDIKQKLTKKRQKYSDKINLQV